MGALVKEERRVGERARNAADEKRRRKIGEHLVSHKHVEEKYDNERQKVSQMSPQRMGDLNSSIA